MAENVYRTSDGKKFRESDYSGWIATQNAAEEHEASLHDSSSSSSSSYTPTRSGSPPKFNYAGDEKDFEKIMHHAYDLIDTGNFDAAIDVAQRLADSFTWEEKLVKVANSVLKNAKSRKAEAEANPAKALVDQGFFAYQKKDNAKAVELWKKAADLGSEKALEFLSRMNVQYTSASGGSSSASADANRGTSSSEMFSAVSIPANASADELSDLANDACDAEDYVKAVALWIKAEEKGCTNIDEYDYSWTLCTLGNTAYDAKNYVAAAELFRKSADMGDETAMNNLGMCYYYGQGVSRDEAKGIEWYKKAAAAGNEGSQKWLTDKGIKW